MRPSRSSSRCMKVITGHEKRVDAEFVKLKECSEDLEAAPVQNGVGGAPRVIGECRSAPALLQSMYIILFGAHCLGVVCQFSWLSVCFWVFYVKANLGAEVVSPGNLDILLRAPGMCSRLLGDFAFA